MEDVNSVGSTLRSARDSAGQSINDCAKKIGVPERYLRALEGEDMSSLPGLVYERHFIVRYARLLGLSPAPLVTSWSDLRRESVIGNQFVQRVSWRDLKSGPMFWRRFAASIFVVALAVYLGSELFVMAAPPRLEVQQPMPGTVVTSADMIISGVAAADASVSVNGQLVVASSNGSFSIPVTLGPGPNSIRIVAEKRYGRPNVVERQVFLAVPRDVTGLAPTRPTL
ncbi:MAG: helix-turn-helix domain-containing protein [Patescibacteria group bacterium]